MELFSCITFLIGLAMLIGVKSQTTVGITAVAYDPNIPAMIITFSESVSLDDLVCEGVNFRLQNVVLNYNISGGLNYVGPCSISDDSMTVTYKHSDYLRFDVPNLYKSDETSALGLTSNIFTAASGFTISIPTAYDVDFIPDTTSPSLASFELDLNHYIPQITFNFDSPVLGSTINGEHLSLTNKAGSVLEGVSWRWLNQDYFSHVILEWDPVTLGTFIFREICLQPSSCYVYFTEDFIQDPYGNKVNPVDANNAIQVGDYISDRRTGDLHRFNFIYGHDTTFMVITFSETTNASSIDYTHFTFTTNTATSPSTRRLTCGSVDMLTYNVIRVTLCGDDRVAIGDGRICQLIQGCVLKLDFNAIYDYSGNSINRFSEKRPINFILSRGDVSVEHVEFDHNRQSVTLTFSPPVDLDSINCDQRRLTYQDHLNPPVTFTPSYSGTCLQTEDSKIEFVLDDRDYLSLVQMTDFWTTASRSYLHWGDNLLGTSVHTDEGANQVETLILDVTYPIPLSFSFDLESEVLVILFDSILVSASVDFTKFALHNTPDVSSSQEIFTLTLPELSTDDRRALCLELTEHDLSLLRNSSTLCTDEESCYVYIATGAVTDVHSNPVVGTSLRARRVTRNRHTGGLGVRLQYYGSCTRELYLLPNEPLVLQSQLGETLISVWCEGDRQLGWKSGGLENVTSPLNYESQSSINFPNGLDPRHFGVFVCSSSSSDTSFTQNFITDRSPFLESPDGAEINVLFYTPLNYWIHFWPEGLVTEIVVLDYNGTVIPVDFTISNYSAVISVDANDVVESISGNYAIVAIAEDANIIHYIRIVVQGIVIEPSNTDVLIGRTQTVLTLTCSPNNQQLPIIWREGERSLTETTPGVSLAPPTLNHRLTLDLDTYSLSGEKDIVCEILHPDDQQIVVSSATIEISLPEEGVEQCEGERDEIWGIIWDTTNEGVTDEQDCSSDPDVVGIARRSCLKGGQWNNPDLSNCESAVFADLREQIEEGLESDDVMNVLKALEGAFTPDEEATIFPQDLITSNNILEEVVAKLIEDLGVDGHDFQTFSRDTIGVFDNMLARTHVESWKSVTEFDQSDASLLLKVTESYAEYVARAILSDSINTNDTVILTEDNIEVWALKLDTRDYSDVVYPEDGERDSDRAQIRIPAAHLSSRRATVVVNMKIENIEKFLPEDEKGVPVALVISSQVIASQDSSAASTPIQLDFTTFPMRYARNPRCVYWNFDQRVWLEDGITVLEVMALGNYSYKVTCESSHLTSFSVIVDIVEEDEEFEFTVDVYVGVGVLTGCALISSLLYSLSLITCCCGEYRSLNVLHLAHLGLSLSLLCVGVLFLAGLTLATENTAACTAVAGLLQYCFTSAFTWILVIVVLATVVVATAKPDSLSWKWTLISILFGLVLPVIPTALSVGLLVDDYGNQAFCWIGNEVDEMALWANVVPMAAISLTALLMVIVGLVFVCIRGRQYTELSVTGSLIIVMSAVVMMVLVGGSWGSGVVMVNGNWDPAHWLFLAFSSALGLVSLAESLLIVCCATKLCNIITVVDDKEKEDTQYWKDKKPLIKEASGLQTAYEMKTTGGDNAYTMMGTGPSDGEMVAMMGTNEGASKEEEVISIVENSIQPMTYF